MKIMKMTRYFTYVSLPRLCASSRSGIPPRKDVKRMTTYLRVSLLLSAEVMVICTYQCWAFCEFW